MRLSNGFLHLTPPPIRLQRGKSAKTKLGSGLRKDGATRNGTRNQTRFCGCMVLLDAVKQSSGKIQADAALWADGLTI